ncbi:uncharacterized protein ACNS7B_010236 isoform 1-T2 [Menidia menidia]
MAEAGRTVRVSGLPTDVEDNKLRDKLLIHFLRAKNGGGEIDSVVLTKATPASALITFEDSKVAQSVIERSSHVLEVDMKKYKLTAVGHHESLDPDQIIISLSATVDYRQLPGGATAMTSVCKSQHGVQMSHAASKGACTLRGPYSKVQAVLAQLLGHSKGPETANNNRSDQVDPSCPPSTRPPQKPRVFEDQSKKSTKQKEKTRTSHSSAEDHWSSTLDLTPAVHGWEDTGNVDGTALEESSLILDADMFQYLQKHLSREYRNILSQYGVKVIDETNQGLTTLFLHAAETAEVEGRPEQERLKLAGKAISQLYQENETKIRRDQLPKMILTPRGGLQAALKNLSVRFPKLLLNEDEKNIYIIGSDSDVSDAKTSLLLNLGEERNKSEEVASVLGSPLYDSGSSSARADGQRVPLPVRSTVDCSDERTDQMLGSEEDAIRTGALKKYKLAPLFKDSGPSILGGRPADFTIRASASPGRPARQGPMRAHDVLTEKGASSGEAVSTAVALNTGGDILFESGNFHPLTTSVQSKTSFNADGVDVRPKSSAYLLNPAHSSLSGSPALPPSGSGSALKRANSFSGSPQQKTPAAGQKSQDDSSKSTTRTRGRSSSFSMPAGKDEQEVHSAQISVSRVMWQYISEAYRTRLEDLTSDVQIKESFQDSSTNQTVTIKGADSTTVRSCLQSLQKLVELVGSDFSVQQLLLSELGVTDKADETLQACCAEIKSRFKKVAIHTSKECIYLVGPQPLCSQVADKLREVFCFEPEWPGSSGPSSALRNSFASSQMHTDGHTGLYLNNNSEGLPTTQTGKAGTSPEWRTTYKSDFCDKDVSGSVGPFSVQKDYVIREKVKTASTMDVDQHKAGDQHANRSDTSPVNGIEEERTMCATQTDSKKQNAHKESRSNQGSSISICVCGDNGKALMRTKCGVTMCPKCLEAVHATCKVCHEKEQMPPGIQGEMKTYRLAISLPGHSKGCVIKITYRIPDGIQGDDHPSPGKPFRGGIFEAYLPESQATKKLLPRLEKAFRQGLTFTVAGKERDARVDWDCIPHKTSVQGGKAEKGYPDSSYLTRLSDVLSSYGIE